MHSSCGSAPFLHTALSLTFRAKVALPVRQERLSCPGGWLILLLLSGWRKGKDERCGRGPGTLTPSLWRTLHDGSLRCFLEALLPVFDPRSHYLAQDSL